MAHVSAADRRPQLIAAAIDLMGREGVAAGSTRAIASELGVAQATVHYTFGAKADLYRAVLESLSAEMVTRVRAASGRSSRTFEEAFRAIGGVLWRQLCEHPERHLLMHELVTFALRSPELRGVVERYYRDIQETAAGIIAEAAERAGQVPAVPPMELARFFLSGFEGLSLELLVRGGRPEADMERSMEQLTAATVALAVPGGPPAPPLPTAG
ncbi:helix-turn-helix domain-containing protein [Streptomyces sp. NPDC001455]|uniref:TetR/AcrR family transcriptional regulator n=1 Tax=unclassified Streptomyces TaxID=2593676 RepID=UPI00332F719A